MKLLKLGIFTLAMGFFIISCGNKNNGGTNTADTTAAAADTSGAVASPALPDTTQHPSDNIPANNGTVDTNMPAH